MSNNFTYTKKLGGFDISIWLVMSITMLLSGLLFSFKLFKPAATQPLLITVLDRNQLERENNEFFIDEKIYIQIKGSEDTALNLDFGDGNKLVTSSQNIEYTYTSSGLYTLNIASINGKQSSSIIFNIKEAEKMKWTLEEINNSIQGPSQIVAGDILNFSTSIVADAYEWTIEGKPEYGVSKEQKVSYSIIREGVYYVCLILNNDINTKTIKPVKVIAPIAANNAGLDDPDLATPTPIIQPNRNGGEEKIFQEIPDELLKQFLDKVIEKQIQLKDFNDYLCDGDQTKVKVNDEIMTFGELFQTLQQKRGLVGRVFKGKPKIKTVKQVRQEGCVTILYVTL